MRRPGRKALCLLATMGSPFTLLILGDKVSEQLRRRDLIGPRIAPGRKTAGSLAITPAGLRALADALEAGELEPFFDPKFRRDKVRLYLDGQADTPPSPPAGRRQPPDDAHASNWDGEDSHG